MNSRTHWNEIYRSRGPDQVSWFEPEATVSLEMIERVLPDRNASIIDVGAGASTLVDGLLAAGYHDITLLDLSGAALAQARQRLGDASDAIAWREGNVLSVELAAAGFDLWHDRAVFHFLTTPDDRARYVVQLRRALRPGGNVLVATFAEDGPARCSGLEVARYSPERLHRELGDDFRMLASQRHVHETPWGAPQAFTYALLRYEPNA